MVFKSLATLLNISSDTGSDFISFRFSFSVGSRWMGSSTVLVEGFAVATQSHRTSTGGRISSSGGVFDSLETGAGVIIVLFLFLEDVSSDNMGNKEFNVGILSFKEGTTLVRFPTVEFVREAFLLYHMNTIPRAITHMPTGTNNAKISVGGNEKG